MKPRPRASAPVVSRWPLTPQERRCVEELLATRPDLVPPYEGLEEDDAVLVHRYLVGTHPIRARLIVLKSRGLAPAGEVS